MTVILMAPLHTVPLHTVPLLRQLTPPLHSRLHTRPHQHTHRRAIQPRLQQPRPNLTLMANGAQVSNILLVL